MASTLTLNISISNAYIFYEGTCSLNQLNLRSVQNIEIILLMLKGINADYSRPSSCFFQCGTCEINDAAFPNQPKTLSRFKSHEKDSIKQSSHEPLIQLGPRPAQKPLTSKQTGKIAIRKRMKSRELQRLKHKTSKEKQLRVSFSNTINKYGEEGNQKAIRNIQGSYLSTKDRGFLQYYLERTESPAQQSIKSADQTAFTIYSNCKENYERNQSRKATATFIVDWKQTVPKLSLHKQAFLKLGQDLPTLRSEAQPTGRHFSQRSGLLKY